MGGHIWVAIFGRSYMGGHIWAVIFGWPYLGSHIWAAIFGWPSLGSHIWPAKCVTNFIPVPIKSWGSLPLMMIINWPPNGEQFMI